MVDDGGSEGGWSDLVGRDQGSDASFPAVPQTRRVRSFRPPRDPVVLTAAGLRGPLSGRVWAGFQVGDLLGRGGMGEVYLAEQRSLGRVVALKVLDAGSGGSPERRARFLAEVHAAARVSSPHVVAVHDSGEEDGHLWLAMECVAGRSLAEDLHLRRLEERPCAALEVITIGLQVASGLASAHAEHLVHRDIKPGNLLIATHGGVKIADFGLVRMLDQPGLTLSGMTLGTPQYMAPEQGRGVVVDARSDLYSLGVVLYELATLRLPFDGDTAETLIFQHNFVEPLLPCSLNPALPGPLQAVIMTCLQKDPTRRYGDAGTLAIDLGRVRDGLAPRQAVFSSRGISTGARQALRQHVAGARRWLLPALIIALLVSAVVWAWRDLSWRDQAVGQREVEELRSRLGPLILVQPVPIGAGTALDRLAVLAGEGDALVAVGRAKLARLTELAALMAAIEAMPVPLHADCERLRVAVTEVEALVGPDGDPAARRARDWLATQEVAVAACRARLAALLDAGGPRDAAARSEVLRRWEDFHRMVASDDPDLRRWQIDLALGPDRLAQARARLASLDAAESPTVDPELLAADLERLAATSPGEASLPAWRARVAALRADRDADRALLSRLAIATVLVTDDAVAARRALAALRAIQALPPAEDARWQARLAARDEELSALRGHLAILDAPRSLPTGLGADLDRLEALVGFHDPQAVAWRARYAEIRALQARLAPLDRAASPPIAAAADHARLLTLVGADDPQVVVWGHKLAELEALRQRLAVCDRAAPLPTDIDEQLAAWDALAGRGDVDGERWRARLMERRTLAGRLAAWDSLVVLPAAQVEPARAALARYRALAGEDAVAARAGLRLEALLGPGAAAWTAASGRDEQGPWCDLAVGGAHQRLRWLPPGETVLGDPEAGEPRRRVRRRNGLWIADSECGQALWVAVMDRNPSSVQDPRRPVERVDAVQAEVFCRRLRALLPSCPVRLPSEAEWEAAMRAGSERPWGGMADAGLDAAVAHRGSSPDGPRPLAAGPANRIGVHDGPGNLWEWCADGFVPLVPGDAEDPLAPPAARRVVRGGSWAEGLDACRLAVRRGEAADLVSPLIGFRFVIAP